MSHWDAGVSPNEVMEPNATSDQQDLATTQALIDMGWQLEAAANTAPSIAPVTDGMTLVQGAPAAMVTIATVSDLYNGPSPTA